MIGFTAQNGVLQLVGDAADMGALASMIGELSDVNDPALDLLVELRDVTAVERLSVYDSLSAGKPRYAAATVGWFLAFAGVAAAARLHRLAATRGIGEHRAHHRLGLIFLLLAGLEDALSERAGAADWDTRALVRDMSVLESEALIASYRDVSDRRDEDDDAELLAGLREMGLLASPLDTSRPN